jgi:DNA repair protein RadC
VAFQKRGQRQVDRKEQKGLSHEVKWRHPGGKLRELGPESLSDTELVAILISSGIKGKPAEKIAHEMLAKFGSFKGIANQPLHGFLGI